MFPIKYCQLASKLIENEVGLRCAAGFVFSHSNRRKKTHWYAVNHDIKHDLIHDITGSQFSDEHREVIVEKGSSAYFHPVLFETLKHDESYKKENMGYERLLQLQTLYAGWKNSILMIPKTPCDTQHLKGGYDF